jgi:RNA polymerase sigma-70 factor (ECF subfamily)
MEACAENAEPKFDRGVDAATLAACQQGDRAAFRRLFDAYKDKVFSVAVYFLQSDVAAAEDITQEVFVRVYTRLGQFRRQADFTTWLYRLTANACMDEHRRRKRRPVMAALDETLETGAETPYVVCARLEINEAVRAALDDLAPEIRLTVLLRYFEELSYEEIAEILQCSQGTVASRLNRSLKTLARKLAHLRDEV